jgi:predicted O-methyltransferase YrrM
MRPLKPDTTLGPLPCRSVARFVHTHAERRVSRSYEPSFFDSGYLNDTHSGLVDAVDSVRGKLLKVDHYKLYEAAYFAQGPILEIGRLAGRSTICLALGSRDGEEQPVYSIEFQDKYLPIAEANLAKFDVLDRVTLIQGDSSEKIPDVPDPDTVFIDGDHTYEGIMRDLVALQPKLSSGSPVLLHDYFHPLNDEGKIGIKKAVEEFTPEWEFRGRFGGLAIFET